MYALMKFDGRIDVSIKHNLNFVSRLSLHYFPRSYLDRYAAMMPCKIYLCTVEYIKKLLLVRSDLIKMQFLVFVFINVNIIADPFVHICVDWRLDVNYDLQYIYY